MEAITDQLTSQEKKELSTWPEDNVSGAMSGALNNNQIIELAHNVLKIDLHLSDLRTVVEDIVNQPNEVFLVMCPATETLENHWILIYPSPEIAGLMDVFDSYGRHMEDILLEHNLPSDLLDDPTVRWITQSNHVEPDKSSYCGQYCLIFLFLFARADDITHAFKAFNELFYELQSTLFPEMNTELGGINEKRCIEIFRQLYLPAIRVAAESNVDYKVLYECLIKA